MAILMLIMISMAIGFVPPLIIDKKWGELAVFTALWLLATIYSSLIILDILRFSFTDIILTLLD